MVNAAGMFAAEIGRMAGVRVPVVPMAHEYVVTQPFRERDGHIATMRDPDHLVYFREEGGGLVWGGYERASAPWFLRDGGRGLDDIPADFNGRLLEEDWDRFEEIVGFARMRVPALEDARVTRLINGPEAFTPDGEFCLGETDVRGLFVAAGFCAHGLAGAGGVGKVMAEWIAGGEPELDLWQMDVRRFGPHYRSPAYTVKRTREVYETYYDIKYPNHERQAGRPLRTSPGVRLAPLARGGVRREVGLGARELVRGQRGRRRRRGCARAAGRGCTGRRRSAPSTRPAGRGGAVRRDVVREARGQRAGRGGAARAAVRQPRGPRRRPHHVHADAQPARRDRVRLHGVAAGRGSLRDRHRHRVRPSRPGVDPAARGEGVRVEDVTSSWACIGLWGPRARDVLAGACTDDLSFGYLRWAELTVGDVPVRALRVTYVGELGWELYCPMEFGAALWSTLWEAGRPHGLVAGGYRAIDSLRLEKGYRVWGADITPDDTPYEGGLGFCVRSDKDFLGRSALDEEPERRLCCLVLEDPRSVALGNEPVRAGGEAVGRGHERGYGYTVERSIAYAYLPSSSASPGTEVAVEIFGEWVGGELVEEPLWIPRGAGPVCNMLLHVHRGHQGPHRGGDRELPAAGAGTRQAQARRRARAAGPR